VSGANRVAPAACVIGWPVAHSRSPLIHNYWLKHYGISGDYRREAVMPKDFAAFAGSLAARGYVGANVTVPHKEAALALSEPDDRARAVGAANTLWLDHGVLRSTNTDVEGFLADLDACAPGWDRNLKQAVMLGAGGAARAVAVALASSDAAVTIHARDRKQAEGVALLGSAQVGDWPPPPRSWDLLVNCTPVGMYPRVTDTPLAATELTGRTVYDLVYNPPVTRLLREAATAGCQTIGGLEMLVAQAHEQFCWWTGVRPAAGVMREAALRRLAEFIRDEDHVI